MRKSGPEEGRSASELIDMRIAELADSRGKTLLGDEKPKRAKQA